jgi:hypothetical protein
VIITHEEQQVDSPYIASICQGHTVSEGATIRPAESSWHMVLVRLQSHTQLLMVGPLPTAGVVTWGPGAEILWIKFRLGAFMPHLPTKHFLDTERPLPGATRQSFWLKSSTWHFPTYDNVETFVDRLVREEVLVCDPVVSAVLQDQQPVFSPRTVRHRFLQATGLTQSQIRQIERAQQAAERLRAGASILDTVFELGYFDQPHLTRSLKRWVGYTPAQIVRLAQPAAQADDQIVQDTPLPAR